MYKYNVAVQSANNINFENNLEVYNIVTSNAYYNIIIVAAAVCILSAMMIPRRRRRRRRRVVHGRYSVYASGLTMIINF